MISVSAFWVENNSGRATYGLRQESYIGGNASIFLPPSFCLAGVKAGRVHLRQVVANTV